MTHRERWQALQAHLAAARASADAGDQQHALVEVNAALALDPDFLAAQSLRDRIVKKSAPPTSTAAAPMNFNAATPAAASPPPAIAERAFPAREAPVQQARLAWWADADVAASKPAAAPAATSMAGLELPIGGWRAADRVTAARSIGDLELRITDGQTATLAPALTPAVAAPAEALRQAPLVSAEGYARFEARAKRRRVDRRVEAARAAIQRRRLHEAAVALNEIIAPSSDPPPVWPYSGGTVRGLSFAPLYPTVPQAALRDRRTRPFSSTPRHLTQISSPSLTMSSVCFTRKLASSLM